MLKLALGSIARTAGPAAIAWLAAKGIIVSDPTTAILLTLGVYGGMQAWSLMRKFKKPPKAA